MASFYTALAAVTAISTVSASNLQGFNYGSTNSAGAAYTQSDYESLFSTAKNLENAEGFGNARLYTMIQGGTTNTPISAIPAAVSQGTNLLLGLWASAGQDEFNNEVQALTTAISTYGNNFTDLVVGISIGSEDLYRVSPMGIEADEGPGANPDTLVSYINQVKTAIADTPLNKAPIGHVDTWTAWVNGSNNPVIDAIDWLGVDAYPYFQNTMANSITDAKALFFDAYQQTAGAAGGKDVWVTETGWPVSGNVSNLAIADVDNAKTYWDEVGCELFGNVNIFWYILQDASTVTPNPSFGIVGSSLSTTPLFDLTCPSNESAAFSSDAFPASSTSTIASMTLSGVTASVSASASATASTNAIGDASGSVSLSQPTAQAVSASNSSSNASTVTSSKSSNGAVSVTQVNNSVWAVIALAVMAYL